MSAMNEPNVFFTRYYREVKAPGIPKGDRAKRVLNNYSIGVLDEKGY